MNKTDDRSLYSRNVVRRPRPFTGWICVTPTGVTCGCDHRTKRAGQRSRPCAKRLGPEVRA